MTQDPEEKINNFISLSEASKITGYHQDYLGFLCRTGKLKGVKIGRNWATTPESVNEFVKSISGSSEQISKVEPQKVLVNVEKTGSVSEFQNKTFLSPISYSPVGVTLGSKASELVGPNLSHLKKEVLDGVEQKVRSLGAEVKDIEMKVEKLLPELDEKINFHKPTPFFPIPLVEPRGTLKNKFASNLDFGISSNTPLKNSEELNKNFQNEELVAPIKVAELYSSFVQKPGIFSGNLLPNALSFLAFLIALVAFYRIFATDSSTRTNTQIVYTPKTVYEPATTTLPTLNSTSTQPTQIVNTTIIQNAPSKVLSYDKSTLYSLIDEKLNQYLLEGKFKGEKGDTGVMGLQGPQGMPGTSGGGTVTYIQPAPGSGTPGSQSAFTYLSADQFTANNASLQSLTVNNSSTFNGGAIFNSNVTLNGTTTIANLNVAGFNPGFTAGSVVFQGGSGLTEDNSNFYFLASTSQLSLGTNTATSSAALQIDSTSRGFLGPRMTTAQRDAIPTPAAGLLIYNTTTGAYNFYDGSTWSAVGTGSGGGSLSGGTKGYVATWASSTALTVGTLIDNASVSGVNATSSSITFNVQGSGTLDSFNVASSSGASLLRVSSAGLTTINQLSVTGTTTLTSATTTIRGITYYWPSSNPVGARILQNDGSGNLTWVTDQTGGGGSVSGGLVGYVTSWASSTGITYGTLIDNGTVAGYNATSSTIGFNIQGTAGSNDIFNISSSSGTSYIRVTQAGNVGIGTTTPASKLSIDTRGSNINPLTLTTNASAGNYTATNSAIFIRDAAGTEVLRIFASDPDVLNNYNSGNLYIGKESGFNQLTDNLSAGYYNTGVGYQTLYSNSTGSYNSALGIQALQYNTSGSFNTGMGNYALQHNNEGSYNTAFGSYAMRLASSSSVSNNTVIGYSAGYGISTGARNIILGSAMNSASQNQVTTGSNNISIGTDIAVASSTASNQLNIGNLIYGTGLDGTSHVISTGSIGIGSTTPTARLVVQGTSSNPTLPLLTVASSTGTQLLTVTSGGNVGIGTTTPAQALSVVGNLSLTGALFDTSNASGTLGMVLQTTGTGTQWVATSSLGFGSSLSGGTNGYVARWTSTSALSTGTVLDNGTVAGINATSSSYSFNIQGTGALGALNIASSTGTSMFAVNADSSINMRNSSGLFGTQIGGATKNTVFFALTPSSMASGEILMYAPAGNVAGSAILYAGTASSTNDTLFVFGNTNNTNSTANAKLLMQAGGDNAGDPFINLSILGSTEWSLGVDNSDSNKFKISASSTLGVSDRFTIDTNGLVGINSTSPITQLAVAGSGTVDPFDVSSSSGSSILRVTSGGKVGIGVTNPEFQLDVNGDIRATDGVTAYNTTANSNPFFEMWQGAGNGTAGNAYYLLVVQSGGDARFTNFYGGSTHSIWEVKRNSTDFILTGNVGIGSSTPNATLVVQGTSSSATLPVLVVASSTNSSLFTVAANGSTTLSSLGTGLVRSSNGSLYTDSATYLTSALTSISALTGPAIHVATSSDTNITISVNTTTANTLTFVPGWSGQLAISRGGTGTSSSPTVAGQLLTSHGSGSWGVANLIAGSNVTITTSSLGSITIAATDTGLTTIGSGNTGFSAIWSGANSLTQGLIRDNGTVAGINATSSTITFNLQGTAGSNDIFNIASSSGTSILTVKPNSRIGIGSSTPTAMLVVQGINTSANTTTPIFVVSSSTGSQLLTVLANGNVGIGSSTPAAKLSIVGNSDIRQLIIQQNSSQNTNAVELQKSDGTVFGSFGGVDTSASSTAGVFTFRDRGLAADGSGVADYNYGAILSVHADDAQPYLAKFYNESYSTTIPVFSYFAYNAGNFIQSTFGKDMQFSSQGINRIDMNIAPSGNVGIGTTTPSSRLQVVGNIELGSKGTSTAYGLLFNTGSTTNQTTIRLLATTSLASSYTLTLPTTTPSAGQSILTDVNGNLYWGSGTGSITGTGTNGYVTRWLTSTTQGTGIILDNGTVAGINATSSTITFNLQGTAGSNDIFNIASSSGTSILTVKPNSRIGIGSSTPTAMLVVQGINTDSNTTTPIFVVASSTGDQLLTVLANGSIGIGTKSVGANTRVDIEFTDSSANKSIVGLDSRFTYSGDVTGFIEPKAIYAHPTVSSAVSGAGTLNIQGVYSTPTFSGSTANGGEGVSVFGVRSSATFSGTVGGAADSLTLYGSHSASVSNLGTIGNTAKYGGYFTVIGTADTNYGVWTLASGATTNYGIYSAGGTNYFADNVGIGTTTPAQALSVVGNMRLTGALFDANNASGTLGMVLQTTGTGTQWVATSSLGFGSSLSGGTNGYVARWTSASTLSTGAVLDNGIVAGINATSSTITFNLQGTAGSNDIFNIASSSGTSILTVKPNSRIGIGSSTPTAMLLVQGINTDSNTTTPIFVVASSTGGIILTVTANDNIGIGTENPASTTLVSLNTYEGPGLQKQTGISIDYSPTSQITSTSTGIYLYNIPGSAKNSIGLDNYISGGYNTITQIGVRNLFDSVEYSGDISIGVENIVKNVSAGTIYGVRNIFPEANSLYWGNSTLYGTYNDMTTGYYSTGTTTAYGMYTIGRTYSTGNSRTFYGNYVTSAATSTGGTQYGMYVDLQPGTATKYPAILLGGNVGIGSTTPTATLVVQGTSSSPTLPLFAVASSTGTQLVTVLPSGNVGIGTISPASLLQVNGRAVIGDGTSPLTYYSSGSAVNATLAVDVASGGTDQTTEAPALLIRNNGAIVQNQVARIAFASRSAYSGSNPNGIIGAYMGAVFVGDGTNNGRSADLIFGTTNTSQSQTSQERVRITSAGNLGIGTATPSSMLQVAGDIQLGVKSAAGPYSLIFNTGSTTNQTTIRLLATTSLASSYTLTLPTTTPSAGNAILTDANGNLYFGTAGASLSGGTAGYLSRWTSASTLSSGISLDNGTVAGINATSSTITFNLQGTAGSNDIFNISSSTGISILRVTNNQRVGIGSTSPTATLVVQGTSTSATLPVFTVASSTGSQLFTVLANGNVGVGTANPSYKLQIHEGFFAQVNSEGNASAILGGYDGALSLTNGAGTTNVVITANGTSYLNGGSLGIGTTTPAQALSVVGNMRLTGALFDANNASGTLGMVLQTTGTGTTWVATSSLGISGSVSGGTNGFAARWTSGSTLSAGKLIDDGSVLGMNATSSTIGFNIQGTAGSNDIFNIASSTGVSVLRVTNNQRVGIGSTSPTATLVVQGTSTSATLPVLTVASSTGASYLTVLANGFVGIGSSTPSALLSVAGETLSSYFTAYSTTSTTTLAGGLNVNNGAILHDWSSGQTSIDNLALGSMTFDTDAGIVNWIDMPVTASSATSTIMSYTGQIDGNPLLTVYAESSGDGGIQNGAVGIGTTTPTARFSVQGAAGSNALIDFASSSGTSLLRVTAAGYLGIGTTTPAQVLSVAGNMRLTGALFDANNASGTLGMVLQTTGTGTTWVATSSLGISGSVSGGTNGYLARWTSGSTLSTGTVIDNGTVAGVNATSSSYAFNIQGTGSVHPLQVGTSTNTSMLVVRGDTGNIGIGTATPNGLLHLVRSSSGNGIIAQTNAADSYFDILSNQNDNGIRIYTGAAYGAGGPALQMWGDSSSFKGMFFDAGTVTGSDINFRMNPSGDNAMTIKQGTGYVGIGTTTPAQVLSVAGNMRLTGALFDSSNASGTLGMVLQTTGTGTQWVATSSLGISGSVSGGTNGYLARWTSGSTLSTGTVIDNGTVAGVNATSSSYAFNIQGTSSVHPLQVGTSTNTSMLVVRGDTGNVGIATTNPVALLHVSGNIPTGATGASMIIGKPISGNSSGTGLVINSQGSFGGNFIDMRENGQEKIRLGIGDYGGGQISLIGNGLDTVRYSNEGISFASLDPNAVISNNISNKGILFRTGGANDRMIITGTGEVGIGTSTPTANLHLVYSSSDGDLNNAGYFPFVIQNTNSSGVAALQLKDNGVDFNIFGETGGSGNFMYLQSGSNSPGIAMEDNGDVSIGSNAVINTGATLLVHSNGCCGATSLRVRAGNSGFQNGTNLQEWQGPSGSPVYSAVTDFGSFGIGTSTPLARLVLQNTATTTDVMRIASSSGTTMVYVSAFGGFVQNISSSTAINIMDGSTTPSSVFVVDTTNSAGNAGLDITAGGAQTGNLLNFFSSGGSQLLAVTAAGGISQDISSTTAVNILNGSGVNVFRVDTVNKVINLATTASTSIASIMATDGNMTIGDNGLTGSSDGRIWIRSRGMTFRFNSTATSSDYSEFFYQYSTTTWEEGTVMTQDMSTSSPIADTGIVKPATTSYDSNILGIVTARGLGYNNPDDTRQFKPNFVNVGMLGHIPVKVTNENGVVKQGDYLTSSAQFPGYAMKATRSGTVIGQALQDFIPNASSTSSSTLSTTGPIGGRVMALVKPEYKVINNTFVLGENDGQIMGQTGQAGQGASSTPSGMLIDQKGIGNILQLQQNGQNRIVFGNGGDFSIMANASSGTTTLLSVTNATTSMFTINARGDLYAKGHITVGHDTAGTATVNPGDNQVSITFDYPYNFVPKVVVTMQGMPNFFYGVTQKSETGFTITMSQAATEPVFFDWVALEQPNNATSVSGQNLNVLNSPSSGGSHNNSTPPPPPPTTSTGSGSATDLSNGETPEEDIPVGTEVGPSQSEGSEPVTEETSGNESASNAEEQVAPQQDSGQVAGETTTSAEPEPPVPTPTEGGDGTPTPGVGAETPPVTDSGETPPTP